jgi:drug/metabolite transporter (DMT)-like permease
VDSAALRFIAIIAGTVLWDLAAVLQKKAVEGQPRGRLKLTALLSSGKWMAGLLLSALGWGLFVFGLDKVPVSAARTITGGSYVILALFSILLLKKPLKLSEWAAVVLVTAGIVLLGLGESAAAPASAPPLAGRVAVAAGAVTLACAALYVLGRLPRRPLSSLLTPMFIAAALAGLLSSVGDLAVKILLSLGLAHLGLSAVVAVGLVAFYLSGFYMLSRAYQAGTMVGSVVISDFFARAGAIFLGAVALGEPVVGGPFGGAARLVGFILVLGGSLLLGRFSAAGTHEPGPRKAPRNVAGSDR